MAATAKRHQGPNFGLDLLVGAAGLMGNKTAKVVFFLCSIFN
jgi:hypothetical protein